MRKRRNQSGSRIERTPIAVGSPFLPAAFSGFRIAHISDLHNTQFGEKNRRLLELLAEMKPDMIADSAGTYTILLSHRPELFPVYGETRIDLSLCGHAHGGQIRLPGLGGIIAPNQGLFPQYTSGLYQRDRAAMIVSRGLGNSLFPFRLNNPPEVVEVRLERRVPASGHADDK